jgi:tRNA threonylcarbamoyl adenosine modification protein (Sua5/YciO/YrdC/YwlC family)
VRTEVVRLDPKNGPWPELARIARIVDDGGLVAFPTETVYGIAANLRDEAAVRRLYQTKGRADEKPLTVHLASAAAVNQHVKEISRSAQKLMARFWPGPLNLVIPDRHGRPTGFRVPDLPLAQEFLRLATCRVGATSANPSGGADAVTAQEVMAHFDGLLDVVVDGGRCRHGKASTVVRVAGDGVEVLREGVVPAAEIREATARSLLFVCTGNRCRSPMAAAFAADLLARRAGVAVDDLLEAGYRVGSAGTGCLRGQPATAEAVAAARRYGCDLLSHRSRPLTPSLIEDADEIYVMTAEHRASILAFASEAESRVRQLGRDRYGKDVDIEDPYGAGPAAYERAAAVIHRAIEDRVDDF